MGSRARQARKVARRRAKQVAKAAAEAAGLKLVHRENPGAAAPEQPVHREQRETAGLDVPPDAPVGEEGASYGKLLFDWDNASSSDLALLRHAINAGWPIEPAAKRAELVRILFAIGLDDSVANRRFNAALDALLAADKQNLKDMDAWDEGRPVELEPVLSAQDLQVLGILAAHPRGLHVWQMAQALHPGLPAEFRGRAGRSLAALAGEGYVSHTAGVWRISEKGRAAVGPATAGGRGKG